MKVLKLTIKNIGKLGDVSLKLDRALILLYGEIKAGKSTVLHSVQWVFGGEFPQDIIKHGEEEGSIELEFEGGMISRSFYRGKDGTTKARAVVFVRNGKPVAQPVAEIKRFLNPFLLDQDFLRNKNEIERKQFFIDLFGVNTADLDTEAFNKSREATNLRAKIAAYGKIDLTVVEPVDIEAAKTELNRINADYDALCAQADTANDGIRAHNNSVELAEQNRTTIENDIVATHKKLKELETQLKAIEIQPRKELVVKPAKPDTTALTTQIQDGGAINERAKTYQSNKNRAEEKDGDEKKLSELEARQRVIKREKQAKLKQISDTSGITGLSFDDEGNFTYDGSTAGMISDSQIMKLSAELSDLYPEGFGLSLIDRGESLGKSIFGFVERAQKEEKTILATIVGERPATVPENIGVFVVSEGKVTE